MIRRPPRSTPFPTRRSSDLPSPPFPGQAKALSPFPGQRSADPGSRGMRETSVRRSALAGRRSEEHTSELQSRQYLVCRLLLEKKKITHVVQYTFASYASQDD